MKHECQQLVEELREVAGLTPPICHHEKGNEGPVFCKPFENFQGLMKEAADVLQEQVVPDTNVGHKKEWIDVKERLPPEDGRYLLYGRDLYTEDKRFIVEISKVYSDGKGVGWNVPWLEVTHWMPLPEAPKGDAEE